MHSICGALIQGAQLCALFMNRLQILICNLFHSVIQLDEFQQRPHTEWLGNREQNRGHFPRAEAHPDQGLHILAFQQRAHPVVNRK